MCCTQTGDKLYMMPLFSLVDYNTNKLATYFHQETPQSIETSTNNVDVTNYTVASLCCLFFFDIRILINPLVSLNSSYLSRYSGRCMLGQGVKS